MTTDLAKPKTKGVSHNTEDGPMIIDHVEQELLRQPGGHFDDDQRLPQGTVKKSLNCERT